MNKKPNTSEFQSTDLSFAADNNIYKIVWVFFICCIVGHMAEMVFAFIKNGEWVNRQGLIYGPFNQIYGLGAVLFTLTLYRLRNANAVIIFAASAVVGAAFEWLCSFAQELAFGSVSWEYSNTPFNLGGRTNLFFAVCWGIMGLIFIRNFYPFLSDIIEKIPNAIGKPLTIVIAIFMVFDMGISAVAVARQNGRTNGLPPANFIETFLDSHYTDEYLAKVYPSMKFVQTEGTFVK